VDGTIRIRSEATHAKGNLIPKHCWLGTSVVWPPVSDGLVEWDLPGAASPLLFRRIAPRSPRRFVAGNQGKITAPARALQKEQRTSPPLLQRPATGAPVVGVFASRPKLVAASPSLAFALGDQA